MAGVTVFRQLSRLKGVSLTLLKEDIMSSANRITADFGATMAVIQQSLTGSGARA
jgi:hypothetical protein